MKIAILTVLAVFTARSHCVAQWAVLDAANLQQSVTNYAVLVEQIARQGEQIANQVRQIERMEDQLSRMGNMADVTAVVGFPNLRADLNLPTRVRIWAEQVADGHAIFGDTRGGIFRAIENEFPDFEGGMIERAPEPYVPAQQITGKVDEFKDVQADAYERRAQLKRAIAQTSEALQAAETEAEEQKLEAILNAQYSQLAALDSEVALSAAEIQVRAAETVAMEEARAEADAESRTKLAQAEAKKVTDTFMPQYECLLQYVVEKPFRP